MKPLLPCLCLAIGVGGLSWHGQGSERSVLILYGGMQGYLSPCGCTSPMSGGIRRASTVIRQLEAGGNATFILTGGLVKDRWRQDELKLETLSETARALDAAALEFSPSEAALGQGALVEMDQLSDHRLVSLSVTPAALSPVKPDVKAGPFLITALSSAPRKVATPIAEDPADTDTALKSYLQDAEAAHAIPVVMFDGDEDAARDLAARFSAIRAIVYRSTADPPDQPLRVGGAVLLTCGFHGKSVVSAAFDGDQLSGYNVLSLGPDVKDDAAASKIYSRYLDRVGQEKLLAKTPRFDTARYAGSTTCRSCHEKAFSIWKASGHFHSLHDLALQRHNLDPDCVSCHVVGLSSNEGYRSRFQTPDLAAVGCESCHGPAYKHARGPVAARLPKVIKKVCVSCHTLENSPGFDFDSYWRKIRH